MQKISRLNISCHNILELYNILDRSNSPQVKQNLIQFLSKKSMVHFDIIWLISQQFTRRDLKLVDFLVQLCNMHPGTRPLLGSSLNFGKKIPEWIRNYFHGQSKFLKQITINIENVIFIPFIIVLVAVGLWEIAYFINHI